MIAALAVGVASGDGRSAPHRARVAAAVLRDVEGGRSAPVLVLLRGQVSARAANASAGSLVSSLRRTVATTQSGLAGVLRARRIPYRSYWIVKPRAAVRANVSGGIWYAASETTAATSRRAAAAR